jgi:hypothetical protein
MRFKSSRVLVVLVAVFAIGAVTAASASAYTNPILVNAKGEHVSKVKFTGRSTSGSIPQPIQQVGASKWECEAEKSTGELSTTGTGTAAVTSGTDTVIYTGCDMGALGTCYSGKTNGEIEGKFSLSLAWIGKESEEQPGMRVSIPPMSEKPGNGKGGKWVYKCGGNPQEVEGAFVAPTTARLNKEFTTETLIATQTNGVQEHKKYTEEGKEGQNSLYANFAGGAFSESATALEEEQTYAEKVKVAKS